MFKISHLSNNIENKIVLFNSYNSTNKKVSYIAPKHVKKA